MSSMSSKAFSVHPLDGHNIDPEAGIIALILAVALNLFLNPCDGGDIRCVQS